jgi:hypothetical protein
MEGIIQSINPYKSGKGAFIRIANTDYMFFGSLQVKEGEKVSFDLGKPSKDGKATIRTIRPDRVKAFVDEDKPRSAPIPTNHPPQTSAIPSKDSRENYWQSKEKRDIENKGIDVMLSCISSACALYEGAQGQTQNVLAAAELFYKAAMAKKGASP